MKKISVITPIFNVGHFVERCVESLMSQTFCDVEYIFVDDASTDDSLIILESVIHKYPDKDIKVIHHEANRGLPSARKTGYEASTGEYIFNCDGDDWTEPTLLDKMYAAVAQGNVDYAYCDFFLTYAKSERYMSCPTYSSPLDALKFGYLAGAMKYNVWNKLIRRELYTGVEFPVDHRKGGEDMVMFYVLSRARSVVHVPDALYHYVKYNENAISEKFSDQRLIDIQYNANYAIQSVRNNVKEDLEREICFFKLNVILPFVVTTDRWKYKLWEEWYPESHKFVLANKNLPFRTRLVQWLAVKGCWNLVWLYNFVCYRILYKILYR